MRHRNPQDYRCSYLVVIQRGGEAHDDLRDLAAYLSTLTLAGCEVIVVDGSPATVFENNRRVLRWVSRHIAVLPRHRSVSGAIDVVRTALDLSHCDRIIVADENVRYADTAIATLCELLNDHEVVEPQDYFDPLPWWIGIEAGRMLVDRGVEALPHHGATFGMRKSSLRGLRGVDVARSNGDDPIRYLATRGAEVFSACDVFVRRLPPTLNDWLRDRPKQAGDDFDMPVKTAFFFALLPVAMVLAIVGGVRLAGGYAGAIAFASLVLAIRGRGNDSAFFPLRACLSAPLWVFERSVSVYWALLQTLRGSLTEGAHPSVAHRAAGAKAASG